jgi:hypothetical protein
MTRSQGQKIVCSVAIAVALLAAWAGVPGCGKPGQGIVNVHPKVVERLGKGPDVAPAAGRKKMVEPPGIKSRLRSAAQVK